jgi:hypothetical protein
MVQCRDQPDSRQSHHPDARIPARVTGQQSRCRIGRAIIANQQLVIVQGLAQNAGYGGVKEPRAVAHRQQDRDIWIGHAATLPPADRRGEQ